MNERLERLAQIVKPAIRESTGGVEFTPNGLQFSRSFTALPPPMKIGGMRGTVKGFSLASARRLRETLFRCDFHPDGMGVVGLCFTLPKEATNQDGADVWSYMQRHPADGLVSLVWRKELQRNGREHYHAVAWSEGDNPLPVAGRLIRTWCKLVSKRCHDPETVRRRMMWVHTKDNDGWFDTSFEDQGLSPCVRSAAIANSIKSMPALTPIDGQGQGVRYLIDHSSKRKAHQANTVGRPWGVWRRESLPKLPHSESIYARLTPGEEVAIARILRKLSRYWVKAPCAFGWRWCRGRKFGHGKHIVADAMASQAVRRWMEELGIIDPVLFRHGRPKTSESACLPGLEETQGESGRRD